MNPRRSVESFPLSRVGTFDVGVIGRDKHHITGLLEVDVTTARKRMRLMRRDGAAASFNAWFLKTVADTIHEVPQVHGVLRGRRQRVVFDEVDIAFLVERKVDGTPVPLPVVIRGCNGKSLFEIDSEIGRAVTQPIDGASDIELGKRRSSLMIRLYYALPQFVRIWLMKRVLANPENRKAMMGTVIVTSVAPGVRFPGWIVPRSIHNLVFGMGSIVRKPAVVGQEIRPRDILHLTVRIDHDVVDGAPATRFVSRLVRNLETAAALADGDVAEVEEEQKGNNEKNPDVSHDADVAEAHVPIDNATQSGESQDA